AAHDVIAEQTAVTPQIAADDIGRFAADKEHIRAEAAGNDKRESRRCSQNKEAIVALCCIDLELLNVDEVDRASGAEDALFADDKVIAEFRADDLERVEATCSIDVDGCSDNVLNEVLAAAR